MGTDSKALEERGKIPGESSAREASESRRPSSFEASLPSVYDYQDFRTYLRAVIDHQSRTRSGGFSLAQFAKALGFSSHSGLAMVLSGKRDLRDPYLEKCVKFLKLNVRQRLYFEALVRARNLSPSKRRSLLREMQLHSAAWEPPEVTSGIRMIDLGLVQQILTLYRGYLTAPMIRTKFRYEITLVEIQRILDWMVAKGNAEKSSDGYRILTPVMTSKDEHVDFSVRQLHRDCLKLAAAALDDDPLERREFQSYLCTIEAKRIPELKQKLKKFIFETISEFETELDADTVIQLHFNMFEILNRVTRGYDV